MSKTINIRRLLIANRGEIACRIIDTARKMGLHTIAVYSEADRKARHVRLADEAIFIGAADAASSYLNQDTLLQAMRDSRADALHPGYGFLSENPDFADAVRMAGFIFVGPPTKAIRAMGLKDEAKRLMADAGVPVVPGYDGADQDLNTLAEKAKEIGYPVLIKARAGGGGKGMRKVDSPDAFAALLDSAVREAVSAFGDGHVIIEKYITAPRHIEVQLLSDRHGTHLHLFERDCSVQRRHQKVIEEAPAPHMPDEVRTAMTRAAVNAAKAIDYEGAGTVEFIADGSGTLTPAGFWFMEMNTRLQVEHPVTERVTGLDLVALQLRVAAGEPLLLKQSDIQLNGHAVEARIYAEDPENDFLPSPGQINELMFPESEGLRTDTGVDSGDEVSGYYDPMIAKMIATGTDRQEALQQLARGLGQTCLIGLTSNLSFLSRLCQHEAIKDGQMTTSFVDQNLEYLTDQSLPPDAVLAAAGMSKLQADTALPGWRHWGPGNLPVLLEAKAGLIRLDLQIRSADDITLNIDGRSVSYVVLRCAGHTLTSWQLDGPNGQVTVYTFTKGQAIWASDGADTWVFHLANTIKQDTEEQSDGIIRAQMNAIVSQITAQDGDKVTAGDRLIVLEAMKMEQSVLAPADGQIEKIAVNEGESVSAGQILCRFVQQSEDWA
ncbi:MAG: biotin carboxylase N-terminal domain-containing protein [Pseudomonadota bacterium]|nr:biotin carboxylase N-terminal domain-containing protein [Pseudomonadota bacterium]